MIGRVLVVESDPQMLTLLAIDLERWGFEVVPAESNTTALELLAGQAVDVVLTDLLAPGSRCVDLCGLIAARHPDLPVIVMTARDSTESAVDALQAHAFDFVARPLHREILSAALRRAIEHRRLVERVRRLGRPDETGGAPGELGGPSLEAVRSQISRVAATDASVLITGESGTGKELAAREICRRSARSEQPFVAVDCAALPASLLESELFGHAKGAFTDARSNRKGLFAEADGGTLFLDELGEIPLQVQPKLLRALENRTVRPVGSDREVAIDVRVIAATNRDLAAAVADGSFRADLYYRVNVVALHLPPLRRRGPELLDLAQRFVTQAAARHGKAVARLADPVARRLRDYPWPGNVRELKNAMECAVVMARGPEIVLDDLPETIRAGHAVAIGNGTAAQPEFSTLEEIERRYILQVLRSVGGRRARAAAILGLDRKTLYRKLLGYGETSA